MSTMKKLIESMDNIAAEGPMMSPSMPPRDEGSPVSVNISMNASGKDHVADLLDMMKNAGLGGAEKVSLKGASPRIDIENFRDIVDGEPEDEMDEITKAQEKLPPELQKAIKDKEDDEDDVDEWANSAPGEEASDRGHMGDYEDNIHDGNDIHRKKDRKAIRTVNPALENIKEDLYKMLTEKKKTMVKGPDGKMVPDYAADGKGKDDLAKGKKSKKVGEGAVKNAMMADAEKMSLKDFIKKYGEENRDTWKAMNEAVIREGKMPSKAHIMKMCKDGKTKAEICKMHPDCDQAKLKAMIDDCQKEMKDDVKEGQFKKAGAKGDGSKTFDEAGCKKEMKKLDASGCSKNEMFQKVGEKYGCSKANFEKLYAGHCG